MTDIRKLLNQIASAEAQLQSTELVAQQIEGFAQPQREQKQLRQALKLGGVNCTSFRIGVMTGQHPISCVTPVHSRQYCEANP